MHTKRLEQCLALYTTTIICLLGKNEKNWAILKNNPVRVFLQASDFIAEEMDNEYAQGHLHSTVQKMN